LGHIKVKNATISIFRFKKNYKNGEVGGDNQQTNNKINKVTIPRIKSGQLSKKYLNKSSEKTPKNLSITSIDTSSVKPGNKMYHILTNSKIRKRHMNQNICMRMELPKFDRFGFPFNMNNMYTHQARYTPIFMRSFNFY
jgi:hypothetical protein